MSNFLPNHLLMVIIIKIMVNLIINYEIDYLRMISLLKRIMHFLLLIKYLHFQMDFLIIYN